MISMRSRVHYLLLAIMTLLCVSFLSIPKPAYAFGCTSNGVSIGGAGTFTIPVDVIISKNASEIAITDMGQYTTCNGIIGTSGGLVFNDALQITGSTFSPQLTAIGFSGLAWIWGTKYNFPLPTKCIWPDGNCRTENIGFTGPINMKIGMQRLAQSSFNAVTVPAGTEIARFTVTQRGNYGGTYAWGNLKTWIFTLRNPLVIPAYTCAWTNPNQTVVMPPANIIDLRSNGAGQYPQGKAFTLNLNCDPETTVAIQFDGIAMTGKNDVLANNGQPSNPVGIQIVNGNTPVVLGQRVQIIANARSQESLAFKAFYFYNGGAVSPGTINATSTVTLSYN